MDCEYCNISLQLQRIVLQNANCIYLQLLKPEIAGSGIIVPKRHRETVFALSEEEWIDTYSLLKQVKERSDEDFRPDGYNVGWNAGTVAGQHIFHAHMHVIPRFADEPFAGKGIRHWFKSEENKRKNEGMQK